MYYMYNVAYHFETVIFLNTIIYFDHVNSIAGVESPSVTLIIMISLQYIKLNLRIAVAIVANIFWI